MFHFTALPPLALYIHLPWCVRKCPYCDFNSHEARGDIPQDKYIEALLRDLEWDRPRVEGRPIQSIFLGGGTPSLFSPEAVARLLAGVWTRLPVAQDAEVTLEANPGTVELERFRGFRQAGINRLSIGIQSFEPEKLRALGRIHGPEEALRAAQAARAAGFENFNLDLMFGLPGQTVEQALADVRTAIELGATHISAYQLTVEPNTLFHARPPKLPDDDTIWEMQQAIQDLLAENGFKQYEVSAYARPGFECRHNLNYWTFGDYLGIGAGAHGKITESEGIARLWKVKNPKDYLAKAGTTGALGGEQRLTPRDVTAEFMLNALRLKDGFSLHLFPERTGLSIGAIRTTLADARTRGLLEPDDALVRPTELGYRFLNDLAALFLTEDRARPAAGV